MRESAPASLRNEHNELDDRTFGVMQEARERARRDPDSVALDRFTKEDTELRGGQPDRWADIAAERWGTVVGLAEAGHPGAEMLASGFGVGPRAEAQRAISEYFAGGDRDRLNAAMAQMMPAEGNARRRLAEEPGYSGTAHDSADIDRTLGGAAQALLDKDADHEEAGATALLVVARSLPRRDTPNHYPDVPGLGLDIFETAQAATLLRLTYRITARD